LFTSPKQMNTRRIYESPSLKLKSRKTKSADWRLRLSRRDFDVHLEGICLSAGLGRIGLGRIESHPMLSGAVEI
jgi:hypothetical protein